MKAKKLRKRLELAKAWWSKQSPAYQKSTTCPGSVKQRIIVGK